MPLSGWTSGRLVAHFTFEITLLQAIMLTLLLVCSFSPRVHSIPRGPRIFARNDNFYPQRAEADIAPAGHITFRATEHIVEKRPTHASWSFFWSE